VLSERRMLYPSKNKNTFEELLGCQLILKTLRTPPFLHGL
jgi:hypothetical protein